MKKLPYFVLMAPTALALNACAGSSASSMDTGQRIAQRGGQISDYGNAWSDGQDEVTLGERMVKKSNDRLEDAQKKVLAAREALASAEVRVREAETDRLKGEHLISDGTSKMTRAEQDYEAIISGPPANDTAPPN